MKIQTIEKMKVLCHSLNILMSSESRGLGKGPDFPGRPHQRLHVDRHALMEFLGAPHRLSAHPVGLQVLPHQLIQVELRAVRWQKRQLQPPSKPRHAFPRHPGHARARRVEVDLGSAHGGGERLHAAEPVQQVVFPPCRHACGRAVFECHRTRQSRIGKVGVSCRTGAILEAWRATQTSLKLIRWLRRCLRNQAAEAGPVTRHSPI